MCNCKYICVAKCPEIDENEDECIGTHCVASKEQIRDREEMYCDYCPCGNEPVWESIKEHSKKLQDKIKSLKLEVSSCERTLNAIQSRCDHRFVESPREDGSICEICGKKMLVEKMLDETEREIDKSK